MSTVRQIRMLRQEKQISMENATQLRNEITELEREVGKFREFVESGVPLARKTINRVGLLLDSRTSADLTEQKIMSRVYDLTGLPAKKTGTTPLIRAGTPAPFASANNIEALKNRRDMLVKRRDDHANAVKIIHRVLNRGTKFMVSLNADMLYDEGGDLPDSGFDSRCGTAGSEDQRADVTPRDVLRLPSIARPAIGARRVR